MTFVRRWRFLLAAVVTALGLAVAVAGPAGPGIARAAGTGSLPRFNVWLPPGDRAQEPLPVLLILHGMGGTGPHVADGFVQAATDRGWLVVAPTFSYGNWQDPSQVAREDPALAFQLVQLLDALPGQTGYRTRPRAMIFGFSRGAQLAQRFAFFYPERVRGVFALAAGTYTVPWLSDGSSRLNLPYGLGDAEARLGRRLDWNGMMAERFVIAVGGNDIRTADVPRQWDRLLGTNRVERARTFYRILSQGGFQAQLQVYPGVDHALSPAMRAGALSFCDGLVQEENAWSGTTW